MGDNNGKWIVRELTKISTKLEFIEGEIKELRENVNTLNDRVTSLESYTQTIDELRKCLGNVKTTVIELNQIVHELKKERTFRSQIFWNTISILVASSLASIIVYLVTRVW